MFLFHLLETRLKRQTTQRQNAMLTGNFLFASAVPPAAAGIAGRYQGKCYGHCDPKGSTKSSMLSVQVFLFRAKFPSQTSAAKRKKKGSPNDKSSLAWLWLRIYEVKSSSCRGISEDLFKLKEITAVMGSFIYKLTAVTSSTRKSRAYILGTALALPRIHFFDIPEQRSPNLPIGSEFVYFKGLHYLTTRSELDHRLKIYLLVCGWTDWYPLYDYFPPLVLERNFCTHSDLIQRKTTNQGRRSGPKTFSSICAKTHSMSKNKYASSA